MSSLLSTPCPSGVTRRASYVGYSGLYPETDAGKLCTVFYLFTGISLIVASLYAAARTAVEQRDEGRASPAAATAHR